MLNFSAAQALEVRNEVNRNIPFIIVSEQITNNEVETAFKNGCTAYVPKANLTELSVTIKKIFSF
jgi:hypothetical protein